MKILYFRKLYLDKVVKFYKSTFNEENVPDIYAIGIFSIIDFIYILSIDSFFNFELIEPLLYASLIILLLINYLIFKFIKPNEEHIVNEFLIYLYILIPCISILKFILF